jgi:hypothetical protein
MQLWAYENEFALWCFLAMLVTAAWMAIGQFRRLPATKMRALHVRAAAIFFPFAVLLAVTALQMAHRTWFAPIVAAACAICIPV